MTNIECAEYICDLLECAEKLNLTENMCSALCKARYETMCKHSPIQEYKCVVQIMFMPKSERKSIPCDTCLQSELTELIRKHGIHTVGSCCGHGIKRGYIQVADHSVNKMLDLGYKMLELDEYGNGKNCFKPKTILYQIETEG